MAAITTSFTDLDAFVTAAESGPDILDFQWNPSFDEFFFADTSLAIGVQTSTSITGTVEFNGGGTAGTFALTGLNFLTATWNVKQLIYSDNSPQGTLQVNSTAGLTATANGVSGSINHIHYELAGDPVPYLFDMTGSVSITTGVGTITNIHVETDDGVNSKAIDVSGSFTINFDTGQVTAGTVTSVGLFLNGAEADVTGLAIAATTFFSNSFTPQQLFITGFAGNDSLTADANDIELQGFAGNDTYNFGDFTGVHVVESFNQGTDLVRTSHDYTLDPNVENATLLAGDGISLTGNRFGNTLTGNANDNTLDGRDGSDVLVGGAGNDTYIVDLTKTGTVVSLEDVVTEGLNAGTDTMVVRTPGTEDVLKLIFGPGDSVDLTRVVDPTNPIVGSWTFTSASSPGEAGGTVVVTFFADGTYMLAQDGSSVADPTGQDGIESGTYTWDPVTHAFTTETLVDTNGEWGFSTPQVTGTVTVSGNTLTLNEGEGNFSITRVTSATNPMIGSWEIHEAGDVGMTNVVFLSATQYMLIGEGQSGDLLQPITGMEFGPYTWNPTTGQFTRGTLLVNTDGDAGLSDGAPVAATVNLGIADSTTYNVVLPVNVENLDLSQAGNTNIAGTGNALNNILTGSGGNNLLDGGLGNDTYVGSNGNDTYLISQAGDTVQAGEDAGSDTVKVALVGNTYLDLSDKGWLENVVFTGTGNAVITGNDSDNSLAGGAGNDTLDGGAGNDVLNGGAGNDTYHVDAGDALPTVDAGIDTVIAHANGVALGGGQENLTLFDDAAITNGAGNALANIITANSFTLSLAGGAGNDTYILQLGTATIFEGSGAGTDLVQTAFDYALDANVENATVLGGTGRSLTGNSLANLLTGSTGNDTLTGGGGNDSLVGGAGNDTYHVNLVKPATTVLLEDMVTDTAGTSDTLVLHSDGGLVLPTTGFTLMLAAALENADISDVSQNVNVTGNAANNILTGGGGNNVLDGGLGNDTYVGSLGNDTYLISQVGDITAEADDGIDTVKVSATGNPAYLNISGFSELENVVFTGTAGVTITGNAADNSLTGGGGNDSINGGAGNDLMAGGAGNDVYTVDSVDDVVNDSAGTGDTVIANINGYTLGTGVENLTLGADVSIVSGSGNALNNILTANANNPTLIGGAGNDTFIFEQSLGVASELTGGGTDLVKTAFDYALDPFVENATVLGTAGLSLTGNALANLLTGGTGNDTLTGGGGNDTLVGGAGNDTYHVNLVKPLTTVMLEDIVTDTAGTSDTLVLHADGGLTLSTPTFMITLAATLENLDLTDTGTLALNATGNASANYLIGNAGNNSLIGGAGNDTLDGYLGNDTFDGGLGNDSYYTDEGDDTFIINDAGDTIIGANYNGNDTVKVGAAGNAAYLDLSDKAGLENVLYTGTVGKAITGNDSANSLTGGAGNDSIDGRAGADTMIGMGGNDTYYVDDAGDSITDSAGVDTVLSGVNFTLGTGLENLTLTGPDTMDIDGTGNTLANKLIGNGGDNFLRGGGGLDSMTGGLGADTFVFQSAVATNVIAVQDFSHAQGDHLALDSGAVAGFANLFSEGVLLGDALLSGTTTPVANAGHAQLLYNTTTGALYYDANGTGGVAAVQIATIVGHPVLAADDFTLLTGA